MTEKGLAEARRNVSCLVKTLAFYRPGRKMDQATFFSLSVGGNPFYSRIHLALPERFF